MKPEGNSLHLFKILLTEFNEYQRQPKDFKTAQYSNSLMVGYDHYPKIGNVTMPLIVNFKSKSLYKYQIIV